MRVIEKAEDLKEIPWRNLTRKEWMRCSYKNVSTIMIVTDRDIEEFMNYQIRKIAIKLQLPIDEVTNVFLEKNVTFYALKENIFHVNTGYCQSWDSLLMSALRELLYIPCFDECCKDNVDLVFKQKIAYLQNLSKLSKAEKRKLRKKLKVQKLKL